MFGAGGVGGFDGGLIFGEHAGFFESGGVAGVRCFVAVERGKSLLDLRDAAMAVHVAETADVHEDVEAQGGSGVEGAKSFVVAAAMAKAQLDDLRNARGLEGRRRGRGSGGRGGGWPSRGGWRPARLQGIRCVRPGRRRVRAAMGSFGEQIGGGLVEFGARLDQVLVWLGVFDERGRGADFAGEEAGGFGGEVGVAEALSTKCAGGLGVDVPGGAGGGFAELCWPRSRTSAMGCESRRETWVSRVRALTIWPREVLVASGSR